ncbi:hypothetical protein, partial [Klebsiella pneumoniae]|uniref:hypothetical protein n=1 Tax=Klebsiella pneumoniae TaxID=573 RepID=UPI003012D82E
LRQTADDRVASTSVACRQSRNAARIAPCLHLYRCDHHDLRIVPISAGSAAGLRPSGKQCGKGYTEGRKDLV